MVSIDEERNAGEQADKVIRMLSVSAANPNVEVTVRILRNASNVATHAINTLSSQALLNNARGEIGIAFSGLIHGLEKGPLTQETIDRAGRAIGDWKNKLAVA